MPCFDSVSLSFNDLILQKIFFSSGSLCGQKSLLTPITTFPLCSTPNLVKWVDVYVRFYIDWTIEGACYSVYFMVHLASTTFVIGLSFYIGAMTADLKIKMREIDADVLNNRAFNTIDIKGRLFNEIHFHSRIFE